MRKNYFFTLLFTLLITSFSFGQVILAEGFDYADGPLVPNGGWISAGGTADTFLVSSGQAVVQHGTPDEDVRFSFTPVTGDIFVAFDFSVDDLGAPYGAGSDFEYFAHFRFRSQIDVVPPTGAGDYTLGISSDANTAEAIWATDLTFGTTYRAVMRFNQDTGTSTLWIDPAVDTDTSIVGTDDGAFSVTSFDLRQSDSEENETVRVDNLMIGQTFSDVLVFTPQTDPSLSIGSITDGQEFSPSTTQVDIVFNVANFTLSGDNGSGMSDGTGDGYIVGTSVENGGAPEMLNIFSLSQMYESLEPGDMVTLTAELVDNSGNSLSPAVTTMLSFSVASYTQVADIAALRAGTEGDYYELTGEAILTFIGDSRNQKYIEDSSAAVLIDDNDGTITTSYNIGDGISGIQGRLSSFGGVLQFVPEVDPGAASSMGNAITAQVVTIAQLLANLNDYESEWITINDINFTDADGSATFSEGSNYDITDGTDTMVFRVHFDTPISDIDGTVIPTSSANVTGLAAEFNGTSQIMGTTLANIVLGVERNEIDGYAAYPNPVTGNQLTITTSSIDAKRVDLFNVLGRKVFSQSFTGTRETLDITNVASGIYILKVTEGTKIATQKLIIE